MKLFVCILKWKQSAIPMHLIGQLISVRRPTAVPQFVLQPIVENSIVHGLDSRHTPMHIALHAYMDDDECITIVISDTGRGIRAEVLEALNCFLRQGAPDVNCYFGMSYAYYRLLPYKADCPPMIIESQNGGGMVITIRYKIII